MREPQDIHIQLSGALTGAMSVISSFPQAHVGVADTSGQASNPLESLADLGPIRWSITTSINTSNPNNPTATVNYSHTCYPAHYVAVNGQTVYSYTPPDDSFGYISYCLLGAPLVIGSVPPVAVPH